MTSHETSLYGSSPVKWWEPPLHQCALAKVLGFCTFQLTASWCRLTPCENNTLHKWWRFRISPYRKARLFTMFIESFRCLERKSTLMPLFYWGEISRNQCGKCLYFLFPTKWWSHAHSFFFIPAQYRSVSAYTPPLAESPDGFVPGWFLRFSIIAISTLRATLHCSTCSYRGLPLLFQSLRRCTLYRRDTGTQL